MISGRASVLPFCRYVAILDSWNIIKEHKTRNCAIKTKRDKSEFVEPQKLIKHTIFTRKNDVNDA